MLVLSRREGEQIIIKLPDGREVTVTVNRINGNRVTLGLEADQRVKILRGELSERRDEAA